MRRGLPVLLFVAIPKGVSGKKYTDGLKRAQKNGVGVLEIDGVSGEALNQPLALSLQGLRPLSPKVFPAKYRQAVTGADSIFRNGEPNKACAIVFDELEAACRSLVKKYINSNRFATRMDVDKAAWAQLMRELDRSLDRSPGNIPLVDSALIARIIGVTSHRNQSGHKPATRAQRVNRDGRLRTRFEDGADILEELLRAAQPWRI